MQDEQVIETLAPYTAQKAFTEGMRSRGVNGVVRISMRLVWATRAKPVPNLLSLSRMRYFGLFPYAVASRRCCATQVSVGARATPTWITFRERSSIMKKAESERKSRSVTGRGVTGPDLFGMSVQEGRPVLSPGPSRTHSSHVLLDRAFADAKPQLKQFTTNTFRSPQSILRRHFLPQRHRLCWYFRFV